MAYVVFRAHYLWQLSQHIDFHRCPMLKPWHLLSAVLVCTFLAIGCRVGPACVLHPASLSLTVLFCACGGLVTRAFVDSCGHFEDPQDVVQYLLATGTGLIRFLSCFRFKVSRDLHRRHQVQPPASPAFGLSVQRATDQLQSSAAVAIRIVAETSAV